MITAILFVTFLIHPIHSCQNGLLRDISTSSTSGSSSIPLATREYWMRAANNALSEQGNPCPFYPFGAVVVNHTLNGLGKLVCSGVNKVRVDGNPTLHGEIVAINNCTKILSENMGLSPEGVLSAFSQLTIYTNGEACPMCASAMRWAGLKEYVYGTSTRTLIKAGWGQIRIDSREIFAASVDLVPNTVFVGSVLNNETDPLFLWQYNQRYPCPFGCRRTGAVNSCEPY